MIVVIVAPVRVSVTGQIDGDQGLVKRDRDGIPSVRVLPTSMQQHDLWIAVTPLKRAQPRAGLNGDGESMNVVIAGPVFATSGKLLSHQPDLVVVIALGHF